MLILTLIAFRFGSLGWARGWAGVGGEGGWVRRTGLEWNGLGLGLWDVRVHGVEYGCMCVLCRYFYFQAPAAGGEEVRCVSASSRLAAPVQLASRSPRLTLGRRWGSEFEVEFEVEVTAEMGREGEATSRLRVWTRDDAL